MTPEELVLTIVDMHARHAPMATIFTVAARALRAERERCAWIASWHTSTMQSDDHNACARAIADALRALD